MHNQIQCKICLASWDYNPVVRQIPESACLLFLYFISPQRLCVAICNITLPRLHIWCSHVFALRHFSKQVIYSHFCVCLVVNNLQKQAAKGKFLLQRPLSLIGESLNIYESFIILSVLLALNAHCFCNSSLVSCNSSLNWTFVVHLKITD